MNSLWGRPLTCPLWDAEARKSSIRKLSRTFWTARTEKSKRLKKRFWRERFRWSQRPKFLKSLKSWIRLCIGVSYLRTQRRLNSSSRGPVSPWMNFYRPTSHPLIKTPLSAHQERRGSQVVKTCSEVSKRSRSLLSVRFLLPSPLRSTGRALT
jgi:hypothetical protein